MEKLLSEYLVCTADQVTQLLSAGIVPLSCFCYTHTDGAYEFAGEYVGDDGAIPAWTMEELLVLIGPDFSKPDLMGEDEWTPSANMMKYPLYLPNKRVDYVSGAAAYAEVLILLIKAKQLKVKDCNERLQAFQSKQFYNPVEGKIQDDIEAQRKKKKK